MNNEKLKEFCNELVPYIDISADELESLIRLTLSETETGHLHYYYLTDNTINFTRLYSDPRPTVDLIISKSDERNCIDIQAYTVGSPESISCMTVNMLDPVFEPFKFRNMYFGLIQKIAEYSMFYEESGTYGERSRLSLFRDRYLLIKNRCLKLEDIMDYPEE